MLEITEENLIVNIIATKSKHVFQKTEFTRITVQRFTIKPARNAIIPAIWQKEISMETQLHESYIINILLYPSATENFST